MTLTINTHVVCILVIYICIAHSLRIVGMVSRGHGYDWLVCVWVGGWGRGEVGCGSRSFREALRGGVHGDRVRADSITRTIIAY